MVMVMMIVITVSFTILKRSLLLILVEILKIPYFEESLNYCVYDDGGDGDACDYDDGLVEVDNYYLVKEEHKSEDNCYFEGMLLLLSYKEHSYEKEHF